MARVTPEHIPASRAWIILISVAIVFAVVEIGLLGYAQNGYDEAYGSGYTTVLSGALGMGITSAVITLVFAIYFFVTTLSSGAHKGYNWIACLVLVGLLILFWTVSWALLAYIVHLASQTYRYARYSSTGRFIGYSYSGGSVLAKGIYGTALAAALIEWFLFIGALLLLLRGPRRGAATTTTTYEESYANEAQTAPAMSQQPATSEVLPPSTHAATPAQQHV